MSTTAPDLTQFMIAQLNNGRNGDYRILEPETTVLMHEPAVATTVDLSMQASGYGWSSRQQQPWQFWGYDFPMRRAQRHGGADYGYWANTYFVEKEEGGFGIVILTNTADFLKKDMLWYFAIYLQFEKLLMDEAQSLWMAKHAK